MMNAEHARRFAAEVSSPRAAGYTYLQTCQQTGVLIDPDCFLTFYSIKSGQARFYSFFNQIKLEVVV
jgi:hypothetical protein